MPGISDIVKDSVIEFSRLRDWMISAKEELQAMAFHKRLMTVKWEGFFNEKEITNNSIIQPDNDTLLMQFIHCIGCKRTD